MQVNSVLGLLGLIVVVALAATAIKNGTLTSNVLQSASSGFVKTIQAATQQTVTG